MELDWASVLVDDPLKAPLPLSPGLGIVEVVMSD
jgi:hypothetical protein